MNEVKLKILTCSDVRDAVGILLGEFGESFQLRGIESAERNFDALHSGRIPQRVGALRAAWRGILKLLCGAAVVPLAVVVALAVGAAPEPGLGEDAVLDFPLLFQRDFVFEFVEFGCQMRRHPPGEARLPLAIACLHIP